MKTWFTCQASNGEGSISIYDEIGAFGITAKDFSDQLAALGNVSHINLSINSPGGSVFDGLAIHNMLKRNRASVTVRVDGIAASIASVIAMAGDAVLMPDNAMMMIHDPSGIALGTSRDMRQLADALDKIKNSLVAAYANKSGLDRNEIEDIMTAETWLSAQEAVDMGFADAIEEPVAMAASFDLSKFKNAPAEAGRKRGPAASTAVEETIMSDSIEPVIEPESTAGTVEAPVEIVAAPETETAEQIEARVTAAAITAANARAADIVAACALKGKAGKAAEYLKAGKSLAEVVASLTTEAAAEAEEISARHNAPADKPASWDKAVAKINSRKK